MSLAERIDAEVAGLRVTVRGVGRPVLLLHGLGSSHRTWDLLVPHLQADHRLIAPDLMGHGRSRLPPGGFCFAEQERALVTVLDCLEIDAITLVGHSWGGQVALSLAAHQPERITHLALVDGGFLNFPSLAGATRAEIEEALRPADLNMPESDFETLVRTSFGPFWRPEFTAIARSHLRTDHDRIRPTLPLSDHMAIVRQMWEFPLADLYPLIAAPTLLVAADQAGPGALDWTELRQAGMRQALELLPRAHAICLIDTVHDVVMQRPTEFAIALINLEQNSFWT